MVIEPTSKAEESSRSPQDSPPGLPEFPSKDINTKIAAVSTLAALGLFLSTRLDFGVSLKDLSAVALPYEEVYFLYLCNNIYLYFLFLPFHHLLYCIACLC